MAPRCTLCDRHKQRRQIDLWISYPPPVDNLWKTPHFGCVFLG